MNRQVTNAIRFLMDECMPPLIRDNKYFVYPLFYIWFKGNNIKKHMEFKSLVFDWTEEEFARFYQERDSLATDRVTDLSEQSIDYMLERLDKGSKTLLDVGCGNGYFLQKARKAGFDIHGCDVLQDVKIEGGTYHQGNLEKLPFPDNYFDIVTCHHTLEHVINLEVSVSELKRVAKNQVVVVVPCQRYFYYTLDEHVRFFPYKALVTNMMQMKNSICEKVWGDWVFIGNKEH
jgi:ubiquinone/menaquinone biosynthesis C-methylase UbiE